MPRTETPPAPSETQTEPIVRPSTKRRRRAKAKQQPPYAVVLHNDDINGADHVVVSLRKVFSYSLPKAIELMLQAHVTGRSIVWSGTLEVAELKADQMRSCGPDPSMRERGALPLQVSIEPLPG
jgi:ATP-dependent Clp protease adaptor protein ClpS